MEAVAIEVTQIIVTDRISPIAMLVSLKKFSDNFDGALQFD